VTNPGEFHSAATTCRHRQGIDWAGPLVIGLWLVYLLISPTIGLGWIDSWHNEQRAAQIALLVLTTAVYLVSCLSVTPGNSRLLWTFPPLLLAFLGIGVISALLAPLRYEALAEVGLVALLAALTLFTAQVVSRHPAQALRSAQWFALLCASAYVLGVATRLLAAIDLERAIDLDVWVLGYANPRFPSALHTLLIPLLAMTILDRQEAKLLRLGASVTLPLLWAINVGLGTRGIWFAYAVALPALFVIGGRRNAGRLAGVIVAAAVAGVAIYYALLALYSVFGNTAGAAPASSLNLTLTSREILWQLSWNAIRASPWLGMGPMQFAALGSPVGAHPHNWVLQIASEWGLPALVIVLYGALRLFRVLRRTVNNKNLSAPLLAVIAALALGLVDGNLVMPASQSATALMLGLLLGPVDPLQSESCNRLMAPLRRALTALLCLVSTALLVAFAESSWHDQERGIAEFRQSNSSAWLVPRFWEQGLIFP
jgi:O-antigen ligase